MRITRFLLMTKIQFARALAKLENVIVEISSYKFASKSNIEYFNLLCIFEDKPN
jgi:hypothetical protein